MNEAITDADVIMMLRVQLERQHEAAFPANELKSPATFVKDEFVVALCDAKDFIDRRCPSGGKRLVVDNGSENGTNRFTETKGPEKGGIDSLWLRGKKRFEAGGAVFRNYAGIDEKGKEFVPREIVIRRAEICEVESQASGHEM